MLDLRSKAFGGAANHLAVLDRTLNQPMVLARTGLSIANTGFAKVKVTAIANAAMIMVVAHDLVTRVAEDGPRTLGNFDRCLSHAEGQSMLGARSGNKV